MLNYLSLSCIQCLYVQGSPFHTRILREVCGSGDLWSVRTRKRRAAHCGSYRSTSEIYCMDKIYTPLFCILKVEHIADIWISEILLRATQPKLHGTKCCRNCRPLWKVNMCSSGRRIWFGLLYPEEGENKLIRNIARYFPSNSSSYIWGLAVSTFLGCDGASLGDTRRFERKCRPHLQVFWNTMQATRSFDMWGVSQWWGLHARKL